MFFGKNSLIYIKLSNMYETKLLYNCYSLKYSRLNIYVHYNKGVKMLLKH